MIQFEEEKQNLKLEELRNKEEEEFVSAAAANRGLKYFNLMQVSIDPDALEVIPEAAARAAQAVCFDAVDKQINVGVLNPDDKKTEALLKELATKGFIVTVFLVSARSLAHAFEKYKEIVHTTSEKAGTFDISGEEITSLLEQVTSIEAIKNHVTEVLTQKQHAQTTKIVEVILAGALATNTSDIHLEPEQEEVRLRYRLDGVLNDILRINFDTYHYILSRIKLISGLKLNVKTEAQDGRFSIHAKNSDIEVRTSILPGAYGESIVLRILNPNAIAVSMDELGLEPHLRELLDREIARPNGMILTTGPTGSGKTTTLYAFLKKVHTPEIKIITIEDPVEYHLPGIVQTQVNAEKGYTFNSGLRAALRQDPDVIMVGEIRDGETAEIAVNAAVTGHLVFSTLHTNTAAGTFPRLLSLGVNPKVISSSLSVSIAQRLARKLCEHCKKEVTPDSKTKTLIDRIMDAVPIAEYKTLPRKSIWVSGGCDKCNMTGYKGRIGIFEAILINKKIEQAVLENPSERDIQEAARDQGLLTLEQDGIIKVLRGITSLDELRRVIDLTEDTS